LVSSRQWHVGVFPDFAEFGNAGIDVAAELLRGQVGHDGPELKSGHCTSEQCALGQLVSCPVLEFG
jgi:hypothetical protein